LVARRDANKTRQYAEQRQILNQVLRFLAREQTVGFGGGVWMPNLPEPIEDALGFLEYLQMVLEAIPEDREYQPIVAIQLHEGTTLEVLKAAREAGCRVLKIYPERVTNSVYGVADLTSAKMIQRYRWAEELGFIASFHGQPFTKSAWDGEAAFHPKLQTIVAATKELEIVMEHFTLASTVTLLKDLPDRVKGTFTLHHLTRSQLSRRSTGILKDRYLHCSPPVQQQNDSFAILAAILNPSFRRKIAFGSDTAFHLKRAKQGEDPKAGIWTPASILVSKMFELADLFGAWGAFEEVMSNGWKLYGLERPAKPVLLVEDPWVVPDIYRVEGFGGEVVPFCAGEVCKYKIKKATYKAA
jgi:dihydroorotase